MEKKEKWNFNRVGTRGVTVIKKGKFDSAHMNLGFGEGHKCARVHGHTFHYEVHIKGYVNRETGLSVDFGDIKKVMEREVEDVLDHHLINEVVPFSIGNIPASAENIAYFIYEVLNREFPTSVAKVELWETPTSGVVVTSDDYIRFIQSANSIAFNEFRYNQKMNGGK